MTIPLGLSTPLVETSQFKTGLVVATAVAQSNKIVAFDGPPGTGKTTTVRAVANNLNRDVALVTMPFSPNPHDLLRYVYRGVTNQSPGKQSRFDLQTDTRRALLDWGGVLIVDELQNAAQGAMQELVWLYEETQHAFGLVVVGSGVLQAVNRHPQLASRITAKSVFAPLTGDTLLNTIRAMHPAVAATRNTVLKRHDDNTCRGNLRVWVESMYWIDLLNFTGPLTTEQFEEITRLLQPDMKSVSKRTLRSGVK